MKKLENLKTWEALKLITEEPGRWEVKKAHHADWMRASHGLLYSTGNSEASWVCYAVQVLAEPDWQAREIQPEIKPCTNYKGCGEMYVDRYDLGRQGNYIRCRGCGARGPHAETPQQAIEAHNKEKR